MASSWSLLDPEEENQLHKSRLFSIEEKPFKRIAKRLTTINQLASTKIRQPLTPPPEPTQQQSNSATADRSEQQDNTPTTATGATSHAEDADAAAATDFSQLKEDITLDFAAFDYTIGRLQFLQSANAGQRERYAAEHSQILDTCARVRENTTQLRVQLAEAQETRARRQAWDGLARAIIDNKALQERPKALASIDKLEEECRQLEAESETYAATWRERKEQFSRIMDESMRLRRLIRDEKEEVERREGMDEGGDGAEAGEAGAEVDAAHDGTTPRPGSASGNATPRPEGAVNVASAVPKGLGVDDGGSTPRASSLGARTPMRDSPAISASEGGLKPPPDALGTLSQTGSRAGSRESSPARSMDTGARQDAEDVEMSESREDGATILQGTAGEETTDDKMDIS
ncbi:Tho complex subunit 7-domain-containing protein [Coniella lustricola]|uniref:Tho complex subunit 7-domain-containing protein n=1 Tax=Coniella lustricola TaxID=2025994 RepID=A0A2T3AIS6_9PEZI|nr:Tho complex subunit 7-domain-containing protein [Coniella lustricola]